MPRTTPLTCNKILGNFFVMFVLGVITFIYSNVMKIYYARRQGISIIRISNNDVSSLFSFECFHVNLMFSESNAYRSRNCASIVGLLYGRL